MEICKITVLLVSRTRLTTGYSLSVANMYTEILTNLKAVICITIHQHGMNKWTLRTPIIQSPSQNEPLTLPPLLISPASPPYYYGDITLELNASSSQLDGLDDQILGLEQLLAHLCNAPQTFCWTDCFNDLYIPVVENDTSQPEKSTDGQHCGHH